VLVDNAERYSKYGGTRGAAVGGWSLC